MNLSHAYGVPPTTGEAERLLRAAVDAGVTLISLSTAPILVKEESR